MDQHGKKSMFPYICVLLDLVRKYISPSQYIHGFLRMVLSEILNDGSLNWNTKISEMLDIANIGHCEADILLELCINVSSYKLISEDHIDLLRDRLMEDDSFMDATPVICYKAGKKYYIIKGNHRMLALKKSGREYIHADIVLETAPSDALQWSLSKAGTEKVTSLVRFPSFAERVSFGFYVSKLFLFPSAFRS